MIKLARAFLVVAARFQSTFIGQLARAREQQNWASQRKFVKIWGLLDQASPRIKEDSLPS
jgi:hypothetical protein